MLIASLVLHQIKEVGTVTQKEIKSECKTLTNISLILTILGLVMVAILHYRKSKLCRGWTFSNTVKIMIFISDVQYYISIKLTKIAVFNFMLSCLFYESKISFLLFLVYMAQNPAPTPIATTH